ncbi:hypothetical protein N7532_011632 [Penicillium argentinense]|uniref:Uncharacterized protein n=1 Tax=Penicillium argentinense TaxID=1131581 RepID=A0A9W9JUR2_9EURO|nr:uncharacterized protein N7532_011632 [Penicillium argentinense]KAJ5082589.1 hypothetical protein N7532_011632 [Penicillium argentinense]
MGVQLGGSETSYSRNGPNAQLKKVKKGNAIRLSSLTPERLSEDTEWYIDMYFLPYGKADPTKTTMVIGISLSKLSVYRRWKFIEGARKITCLHHERAFGTNTQAIYLSWNAAAVRKEADDTPPWSTNRSTTKRGAIIICAEELALVDYCSQLDHEDETTSSDAPVDDDASDTNDAANGNDSGIDDDDDLNEESPQPDSKRKAQESHATQNSEKLEAATPRNYLLKLSCREVNGPLRFDAFDGTIDFQDEKFASFEGEAYFPCAGYRVPFVARKVTDVPEVFGRGWGAYGEERIPICASEDGEMVLDLIFRKQVVKDSNWNGNERAYAISYREHL